MPLPRSSACETTIVQRVRKGGTVSRHRILRTIGTVSNGCTGNIKHAGTPALRRGQRPKPMHDAGSTSQLDPGWRFRAHLRGFPYPIRRNSRVEQRHTNLPFSISTSILSHTKGQMRASEGYEIGHHADCGNGFGRAPMQCRARKMIRAERDWSVMSTIQDHIWRSALRAHGL